MNPWSRLALPKEAQQDKNIEEKESFKWIECLRAVTKGLTNPMKVTFVGDRENDIFDYYEEFSNKTKHEYIVRARHDRTLANGDTISEHMNHVGEKHRGLLTLPRTRERKKKRLATFEYAFSQISLKPREKEDEGIKMYCVYAIETSAVPKGEPRVSWVLLTSHKIENSTEALQILQWYTWRWVIEEVHRTMKKKGMAIESSQIQNPTELLKLSMLCFGSATKIMLLVQAREGSTQRADVVFSETELIVLQLICKKIEGKTEKQKNPHATDTMGWASWIIGRLGGWKGYASESPPGPITMRDGLVHLYHQHEGWLLAQEMCA